MYFVTQQKRRLQNSISSYHGRKHLMKEVRINTNNRHPCSNGCVFASTRPCDKTQDGAHSIATSALTDPSEHRMPSIIAPSKGVTSCLNVLKATNPADTERNLAGLSSFLSSGDAKELSQNINRNAPLNVARDSQSDDRPFILCNWNSFRSTSSNKSHYRSPWSNTYHPPLMHTAGSTKSEDLLIHLKDQSDDTKNFERQANEVWDAYKTLYYGRGAVGSVYVWTENKEHGFSKCWSGCFLIHKSIPEEAEWNSVHLVDVTPSATDSNSKATYHIQSTVTVHFTSSGGLNSNKDTTNNSTTSSAAICGTKSRISGSLEKTTLQDLPLRNVGTNTIQQHLKNVGTLLEEAEIDMRSNMDVLGIQKTRQVVEYIRPPKDPSEYYAYRPKKTSFRPPVIAMAGTGAAAQQHNMALQQAVLARALKKKANIS